MDEVVEIAGSSGARAEVNHLKALGRDGRPTGTLAGRALRAAG